MKMPIIRYSNPKRQKEQAARCHDCRTLAANLCDESGCFNAMCKRHSHESRGRQFCSDHKKKANPMVATRGEFV